MPSSSNLTGIEVSNGNISNNFDNFAVDANNKFAYMAVKAVTQEPGSYINPLLIYGGTGLGKSHLIQAAFKETLRTRKNFRIQHFSCDDFFKLYINALNNNRISKFRNDNHNFDMLLIEGIQFLSGRNEFQKEFLDTCSYLYENEKQIILTSDNSPNKIDGLEPKMLTWLEGGLTIDMLLR